MKVLPTHSGEHLSLIVRITIWWLKIIGLAPFSLRVRSNSTLNSRGSPCTRVFLFSKIGTVYNVLLLLLAAVVGVLGLSGMYDMNYPNRSPTTQVIDLMQGIIRIFTICVIFGVCAFKQRNAISIMNRLLEVDRLLSGMKNHPPRKRTLLIFVSVQMMLNAILWVVFFASEGMYIMSILHWFIFNVPIFVTHWFLVQYAILLGVVAMEFESLNQNLLNFQEFPNYLFRTPVLTVTYTSPVLGSPTYCRQLAALELLHKIRTTLSEVSQDIADFFSFPTLPAVASFSLTLIVNLWFVSIPILIPGSHFVISITINAVTWILACIYPLIALSSNTVKTLKEAQLTGLIIHKLLARSIKQEIQRELERFSLHLVHEKLSFTAHEFFALDFTLIQSIFGVTATYLMIVVQFTQSAANTCQNTLP